jgi:NAD(P)-dependent dehydrogenase (short-subunit alcohol dehydrogenase family)
LGFALDSGFFYASAFAQQQFRLGKSGDILMIIRPDDIPGRSAAAAARGGIRNLVQTLAVEWARDGLRVNAIESGLMDGGNVEEIRALSSLCAYLLSDFASYVTGAVVGVNDVHASTQ